MKTLSFLLSFLITDYWLLITAKAVDLGIHGHTFEIEEPDLLKQIEHKLEALEKDGSLARDQETLLKRAEDGIRLPQPVTGITKATTSRIFYYDPSLVVPYNLKDHKGRIFQKAGTRFNPLTLRSLSSPLIFIDGEDEAQVSWVSVSSIESSFKTHIQPKIILTSGAPFALMEKWKQPVYFDQGGRLTKKLKIKHVPAVVVQEGLKLKVSEIALEDTQ
ncbi:MAG: type-F conjugative transfer system protein TraW [Alphaproteobacteria bacterium 41-28]|nr:MAG: type-F conjugative transfer system protein TraW [Alphaproteobacteria bacterium 41-28]